MTLGDFEHAANELRAQLLNSDFLADRGPNSEPIRVVIRKVENLTSDVIPPAEQWMFMARIRSGLSVDALRDRRNITFLIPPERHKLVRKAGFEGGLGPSKPPTHAMTATFRSSTRTKRGEKRQVRRRQDYYYLECAIKELDSREIEWTGTVEFKREATGLAID